jgi:hypothetical protein
MTVADVVKTIEAVIKAPPAPEKATPPANDAAIKVQRTFLKLCDDAARNAHPEDYDAVLELSPEILNDNPQYLAKVGEALANGENPAETAYSLIKADPEFAKLFPVAQTKVAARKKSSVGSTIDPEKEKRAKEAEEALKRGQDRPKTSGHVSGGSSGESSDPEIDIDAVRKMSDLEFARLPKAKRQAILKKFG